MCWIDYLFSCNSSQCVLIYTQSLSQAYSMTSNPIRYRIAVLLIWAAITLVANPVLHALSHQHVDCTEDVKESNTVIQWSEQDLCPFCDAVSQFGEPPVTDASFVPLVLQWNIKPDVIHHPDLRLSLSTRLRAPPFLT